MSKPFDMNLQFFADPNDPKGQGGSGAADEQGSGGEEQSHGSDGQQGGSDAAKYTQADIDRMLREKDSEVSDKIGTSLANSYSAELSDTVKHEVARANMTAEQKRADDHKQAVKHQQEVEAQLKEYKARDVRRSAVATAQTGLTSAGVPQAASVAAFVADSDSTVQASKTSAFLNWFSSAAAGVKKNALTPDHSQSMGSTNVGDNFGGAFDGKDLSKIDPTTLTFGQYTAYRTALANQKANH